mgnify:FL=1|tara:strand:- start:549 stop:854 length:306 start_codon:yes stop_codon:yes gene_type:complete
MPIRDNTRKKNIADNIFNILGLPKNYAAKLIDDLNFILISNIVRQGSFKVKNFGTFNLRKKIKRAGRNPKNQIKHDILERNVVTFKAAEGLKRKINRDVKN